MALRNNVKIENTWSSRGVVLVSTSENMYLVIKGLIQVYNWNTVAVTSSPTTALDYIKSGSASIVVIDDSLDNTSISSLRTIMTDPIGCITPILCLLMDKNGGETSTIQRLGQIKVVPKPVTPASFAPLFTQLVKTWETKPLTVLRNVLTKIHHAPDDVKIKTYDKLKNIEQISHLVTRTKALTLLYNGQLKEAERECLVLLKKRPHDLGLFITLGDIYIRSAMPQVAQKLFERAAEKFSDSVLVLPDIAQSAYMSGKIERAIAALRMMYNKEYMQDKSISFLGRILYAEGRLDEAALLLGSHQLTFNDLEKTWKSAINQNTEAVNT